MAESFDGSTLYAGFLLAVVGYWVVFFTVKAFVRRSWPKLHEQLSQDKAKKLTPFIVMIVRIFCGLTMSFPTCIWAARTTEWGYGRRLNKAGQICVASQGLVWVTELQAMADFSDHLLVHHLMCIVVMANVIIAPNIHQIKPLYMFFASQCADVGPGTISILKSLGLRPHNSQLLRYVTMASTACIVCSKVGITLHSFAMAFHSPHRIGDWAWGFCLLFFGVYCLDGAYKNLKWIDIVSVVSEQPAGLAIGESLRISLSTLVVAFGTIGAMFYSVFMYSATLNHPLQPYELPMAWLANVAMLLFGSVVVYITSRLWKSSLDMLQVPNGSTMKTSLFYQLAAIMLSVCSLATQLFDLNTKPAPFDLQRALAAASLSIPLWEAIMQTGNCLLLKHERRQNPPEEVMEKATIELVRARARQNQRETVFHQRMAGLTALVLISVMCLPSSSLIFVERGKIGLGAHALVQVVGEIMLKPRPVKTPRSKSKATVTSKVISAVPAVVELALASSNMSVTLPLKLAGHYLGLIAVVVGMASSSGFVYRRIFGSKQPKAKSPSSKSSGSNSPKSDSGSVHKQTCNTIHVSVVAIAILQVIMAKEVLSRPNYSLQGETSVGFQNLRTAIRSGPTVPGIIVMAMSMWAAIDIMKRKR